MNWWKKSLGALLRSITPQEFMTGADLEGGTVSTFRLPYAQSVWVQAALNLVTQPIKSVPLKFYAGDVEVEEAEIGGFWSSPAQGMSRDEWLDATLGWFKLRGEFFWLLDDSWLAGTARKSRFIVARPDEMREIVVNGVLLGWTWTAPNQRRMELLPEQVIQAKRWNPYNAFRGLGEMQAATLAAETDFLAGRFARDSYANAGEQGDYVFSKGPAPTDAQREQIIATLRAKRAAKMRGEFRPVFLSGDVDVKPAMVSGPDANMVANRLQSRHEVFVAFGVPASMADVQASYSIGSASDYFRLVQGTCMPLAATAAGAINRLLRRQTGRAIEAFFDFDEHPVMQAVRNERVDAAQKLFGMGVPLAAINDYLDMGMKPVPGWDQGWLPFSLQPAGTPLSAPVAEIGSPAADPVGAMVRALQERSGKAEMVKTEKLKGEPAGCVHCAGEVKSAKWLAHWQARQASIKLYESKFNRQLMVARAEVLGKIQSTERGAGAEKAKAVVADLLFDLEDWADGLVIEMNKAGRSALDTAGRQAKAEIGQKDDAWTMPPPKAVSFLNGRENFMRDIADDVHARIEAALIEGISGGETSAELAARVRETFNGISRGRALVIAQTETGAAYGAARQESLEQSGVEWKEWLTSGNDNVRPSHEVAEGQRRKISEPFTVGGASLMHPGDGSLGAPPEEIINCHCVSVAAEEEKL